jgi:hypothetical protein
MKWKWWNHSFPWFKMKKPIEPQEVSVADIMAKVYELHPNVNYLFWFERPMNPQWIQAIRNKLVERFSIEVVIMSGIQEPLIYEFEETNDGTKVTTTSINPSKASNEDSKP